MRIPAKIPGRLSIRGGSPTFSGGAAAFHYAIGGLPWLSAASLNATYRYGDRRIQRSTAPFRKQQFDNASTPGEQSLDGFWIRSQQSFHGGAGQLYSDPANDNPESSVRFWRSKNVDPWTRGQLALLHQSTAAFGSAKASVIELFSLVTGDGTSCVIVLRDADMAFLIAPSTTSSKTVPGAGHLRSVTSDGNSIFVAASDGVWKAAVPTAATTDLSWTKIYTVSSSDPMEIAWVKERLMLGVGQNLYELSPSPAGAPAALPTATYTAKPANWSWTSISETSPAIYAVGSAGHVSSILKFTLDTNGALPTLTGGSVAATLPGGERAVSVFGYLGNFLAMGTTKGVRIAESNTDGSLTYGPLLFETTGPVSDWTGRDRFLWCTYAEGTETTIKLARVDLSLQVDTLRFAYATDLVAVGDTSTPAAVAFYGDSDQLAFATANDCYREDETKWATTGYLYTSRIRFSTLEPKNFRNFRVRAPELQGGIGVSVVDNTGVETPVTTFGIGQVPGDADVTIQSGQLQDFMQLKFTLSSTGATNDPGAMMYGWQLKALPGAPRQRMIVLPLLCYDWETDKHGQRIGGDRTAIHRLMDLEALDAAGGVTTLQDFDANVSYDVFIEELLFVQVDPPPMFEGWGGIVTVTLRTV